MIEVKAALRGYERLNPHEHLSTDIGDWQRWNFKPYGDVYRFRLGLPVDEVVRELAGRGDREAPDMLEVHFTTPGGYEGVGYGPVGVCKVDSYGNHKWCDSNALREIPGFGTPPPAGVIVDDDRMRLKPLYLAADVLLEVDPEVVRAVREWVGKSELIITDYEKNKGGRIAPNDYTNRRWEWYKFTTDWVAERVVDGDVYKCAPADGLVPTWPSLASPSHRNPDEGYERLKLTAKTLLCVPEDPNDNRRLLVSGRPGLFYVKNYQLGGRRGPGEPWGADLFVYDVQVSEGGGLRSVDPLDAYSPDFRAWAYDKLTAGDMYYSGELALGVFRTRLFKFFGRRASTRISTIRVPLRGARIVKYRRYLKAVNVVTTDPAWGEKELLTAELELAPARGVKVLPFDDPYEGPGIVFYRYLGRTYAGLGAHMHESHYYVDLVGDFEVYLACESPRYRCAYNEELYSSMKFNKVHPMVSDGEGAYIEYNVPWYLHPLLIEVGEEELRMLWRAVEPAPKVEEVSQD